MGWVIGLLKAPLVLITLKHKNVFFHSKFLISQSNLLDCLHCSKSTHVCAKELLKQLLLSISCDFFVRELELGIAFTTDQLLVPDNLGISWKRLWSPFLSNVKWKRLSIAKKSGCPAVTWTHSTICSVGDRGFNYLTIASLCQQQLLSSLFYLFNPFRWISFRNIKLHFTVSISFTAGYYSKPQFDVQW